MSDFRFSRQPTEKEKICVPQIGNETKKTQQTQQTLGTFRLKDDQIFKPTVISPITKATC